MFILAPRILEESRTFEKSGVGPIKICLGLVVIEIIDLYNTQMNTFHENEAETRSPREATKFRPMKFRPRFEKAAVCWWLSLYFFTRLFSSQDRVLALMNRIFKAVRHNYITYDIESCCKLFQDQDFEKG